MVSISGDAWVDILPIKTYVQNEYFSSTDIRNLLTFVPVNSIVFFTDARGTIPVALDADLIAIANLTGTGVIYYRSAADTWSPIIIGSGITFINGTLSASGIIGPSGLQGIQGPSGVTGLTGPSGATGLTGPSGATGQNGLPGTGTALLSGIIISSTNIVIPRRDLSRPVVPSNPVGLFPTDPAVYDYPAVSLHGVSSKDAVLIFPNTTGYLVSTEQFGRNTLSSNTYYYSGNTLQSAVISNFAINGSGDVNPNPLVWNSGHPSRCTGLAVEAMSANISNIEFYDIRGTALYVQQPNQTSGNAFVNMWQDDITAISNIVVKSAFNGIVINPTDTKLDHIYIRNARDIGLTVNGHSVFINQSHIYGASTGVAIYGANSNISDVYWEAAEIGLDIIGGHATRINNFYGGPATCWKRIIRVNGNGCDFRGIALEVQQETVAFPDIAGIEYVSNLTNQYFEGSITLNGAGSTSKGMILGSCSQSEFNIKGGWNSAQSGTLIKVTNNIDGVKLNIKGYGKGGCILNLSGTTLNTTSGYGNDIDITWAAADLLGSNAVTGIVYPGGGLIYNLTGGTSIKLNGRVLS